MTRPSTLQDVGPILDAIERLDDEAHNLEGAAEAIMAFVQSSYSGDRGLIWIVCHAYDQMHAVAEAFRQLYEVADPRLVAWDRWKAERYMREQAEAAADCSGS